jgi:hypothetical protein
VRIQKKGLEPVERSIDLQRARAGCDRMRCSDFKKDSDDGEKRAKVVGKSLLFACREYAKPKTAGICVVLGGTYYPHIHSSHT